MRPSNYANDYEEAAALRTVRLAAIDDDEAQEIALRYCIRRIRDRSITLMMYGSIEAFRARGGDPPIDLLLSDSRVFPHRSYVETVPLIRESGYGGPIVVLSGSTFDGRLARHARHGVAESIDKLEFSPRKLSDLIDRYVLSPAG